MADTLTELMPCPFCGGKAEFIRMGTPRYSTVVRCTDCNASLESNENFEHGTAWNTRADQHEAEKEQALKTLADLGQEYDND